MAMQRERGSKQRGPLYKGHELEAGESVVWCSNRKTEHNVSLGQLVITDRRLLFEPLRMIGNRGRRWAVELDGIEAVEMTEPPRRPWPTRGRLELSLAGGKSTYFNLAGDGWFPSRAAREAALEEAHSELRRATGAAG